MKNLSRLSFSVVSQSFLFSTNPFYEDPEGDYGFFEGEGNDREKDTREYLEKEVQELMNLKESVLRHNNGGGGRHENKHEDGEDFEGRKSVTNEFLKEAFKSQEEEKMIAIFQDILDYEETLKNLPEDYNPYSKNAEVDPLILDFRDYETEFANVVQMLTNQISGFSPDTRQNINDFLDYIDAKKQQREAFYKVVEDELQRLAWKYQCWFRYFPDNHDRSNTKVWELRPFKKIHFGLFWSSSPDVPYAMASGKSAELFPEQREVVFPFSLTGEGGLDWRLRYNRHKKYGVESDFQRARTGASSTSLLGKGPLKTKEDLQREQMSYVNIWGINSPSLGGAVCFNFALPSFTDPQELVGKSVSFPKGSGVGDFTIRKVFSPVGEKKEKTFNMGEEGVEETRFNKNILLENEQGHHVLFENGIGSFVLSEQQQEDLKNNSSFTVMPTASERSWFYSSSIVMAGDLDSEQEDISKRARETRSLEGRPFQVLGENELEAFIAESDLSYDQALAEGLEMLTIRDLDSSRLIENPAQKEFIYRYYKYLKNSLPKPFMRAGLGMELFSRNKKHYLNIIDQSKDFPVGNKRMINLFLAEVGKEIIIEKKENPRPENLELELIKDTCSLEFITPLDEQTVEKSEEEKWRMDFPEGAVFEYEGLRWKGESRPGVTHFIDHVYVNDEGELYLPFGDLGRYIKTRAGKPFRINILGREDGYQAQFMFLREYLSESRTFERIRKEIKEDRLLGDVSVNGKGDFCISYAGQDFYSNDASREGFEKISKENIKSIKVCKNGYMEVSFSPTEEQEMTSGSFTVTSTETGDDVLVKNLTREVDFSTRGIAPGWKDLENEFEDQKERDRFAALYGNHPDWEATISETGNEYWRLNKLMTGAGVQYDMLKGIGSSEFMLHMLKDEDQKFFSNFGGRDVDLMAKGMDVLQDKIRFEVPKKPKTHTIEYNVRKVSEEEEKEKKYEVLAYPNPVSKLGQLKLRFASLPPSVNSVKLHLTTPSEMVLKNRRIEYEVPVQKIPGKSVLFLNLPQEMPRGTYSIFIGEKYDSPNIWVQ